MNPPKPAHRTDSQSARPIPLDPEEARRSPTPADTVDVLSGQAGRSADPESLVPGVVSEDIAREAQRFAGERPSESFGVPADPDPREENGTGADADETELSVTGEELKDLANDAEGG